MSSVFNIRLGHACNSSSSHSIVPLGLLLAHRGVKTVSDDCSSGAYGNDNFTLASTGEKMTYLACVLESNGFDLDQVEEITGIRLTVGSYGTEEYVDHQSVFPVPQGNIQFARELASYLKRKSVLILGGSDGGGSEVEGHFPWKSISYTNNILARKDTCDQLGYWTMFSPGNGNKIRFSFDDATALSVENLPRGLGPAYASAPELVDMKITGFCPFSADCPMCYMDSDSTGEHADTETIRQHLRQLAQAGVFEIALGGGEPTLHPDFTDILAEGASLGLAMNFTTKNFSYFMKDTPRRQAIIKNASAIAFSVNSREDLEKFQKVHQLAVDQDWKKSPYYNSPGTDRVAVTLQTIPALHGRKFMEDLLRYCDEKSVRVTLLGFKRVGRARDEQAVNPNHRWIEALVEVLKDQPNISSYWISEMVAIDTLMAAECKDMFDEAGINPIWYHTDEGAFSCYVDATQGLLGASSFVEETEMIGYDPVTQDLCERFAYMQDRAGIR